MLKGIAICAMLFYHLFFEHPEFGDCIWRVSHIGKVCVSIFLFLSGYGLATQYKNNFYTISLPRNFIGKFFITTRFLCKRFIKFYLSYWVIFFSTLSLGVFLFHRPLQEAYGNDSSILVCLMKDFFALQRYNSYNITWWFNHLILSLYAAFPILYWLVRKKSIAIGFMILLFFWPRDWIVQNFFYYFQCWDSELVVYTLIFFLGIFFSYHADFFNNILNKTKTVVIQTFSLLFLILFTLLRLYWKSSPMGTLENMCIIDAGITISLTFTLISFCRLAKRQLKPLIFLGKHSMNMYLVHTFIFSYFFSDFIYGFKYPILIFAGLLATSLLFSISLEFVKTKLGFYRLQSFIFNQKFLATKDPTHLE